MSSRHAYGYSLAVTLAFGGLALAGPEHIETGDAGSYKSTAQKVYKSYTDPHLDLIMGQLSNSTAGKTPDLEDMYIIRVTDPEEFSASTDPGDCVMTGDPPSEVCGYAEFDSQLWIMRIVRDEDGVALLANDEKFTSSGSSKLTGSANDGSGNFHVNVGEYLIAITAYGNVPQSSSGNLYTFANRTEVSGADGPGAHGVHSAWTGGGPSVPGDYTIVFTGAAGFPLRIGEAATDHPRYGWAIGGGGFVLMLGLSLSGVRLLRGSR